MSDQRTPSATWREQGEPDPHGDRYACERAALAMGDMTDDQLANAVFMNGNRAPTEADLLAGHAPIVYLTAAKDRIRWLSRALEEALAENKRLLDERTELQVQAARWQYVREKGMPDSYRDKEGEVIWTCGNPEPQPSAEAAIDDAIARSRT